jgi:hypothetical protein
MKIGRLSPELITNISPKWEALNEDISVAGLLEGRGDMTKRPKVAA